VKRPEQRPRWASADGRPLGVVQAHTALFQQQPAEPPDRRALVAMGLLIEQ